MNSSRKMRPSILKNQLLKSIRTRLSVTVLGLELLEGRSLLANDLIEWLQFTDSQGVVESHPAVVSYSLDAVAANSVNVSLNSGDLLQLTIPGGELCGALSSAGSFSFEISYPNTLQILSAEEVSQNFEATLGGINHAVADAITPASFESSACQSNSSLTISNFVATRDMGVVLGIPNATFTNSVVSDGMATLAPSRFEIIPVIHTDSPANSDSQDLNADKATTSNDPPPLPSVMTVRTVTIQKKENGELVVSYSPVNITRPAAVDEVFMEKSYPWDKGSGIDSPMRRATQKSISLAGSKPTLSDDFASQKDTKETIEWRAENRFEPVRIGSPFVRETTVSPRNYFESARTSEKPAEKPAAHRSRVQVQVTKQAEQPRWSLHVSRSKISSTSFLLAAPSTSQLLDDRPSNGDAVAHVWQNYAKELSDQEAPSDIESILAEITSKLVMLAHSDDDSGEQNPEFIDDEVLSLIGYSVDQQSIHTGLKQPIFESGEQPAEKSRSKWFDSWQANSLLFCLVAYFVSRRIQNDPDGEKAWEFVSKKLRTTH